MPSLLDRLRMDLPIVQAGMGGLSRHELAAAVADAGGLGTISAIVPGSLDREISAARSITNGPIAVNVLLPFATKAIWQAAHEADAIVTFWGRPARRSPKPWIHQCGSVDEAKASAAAGADAVIAQGVESGGHVRGTTPALELLEQIRHAVPGMPVLVAGGIADRADVHRVLDGGAEAAVLGTRFLATDESRAHPIYKQRLIEAQSTVLTELFGAGWPHASHRVIANAATERWLAGDLRGPVAIRAANRALSPVLKRLPTSMQYRLLAQQKPNQPLLSPNAATDDGPPGVLDSGPLYAGQTVARIDSVRGAGALARDLAP